MRHERPGHTTTTPVGLNHVLLQQSLDSYIAAWQEAISLPFSKGYDQLGTHDAQRSIGSNSHTNLLQIENEFLQPDSAKARGRAVAEKRVYALWRHADPWNDIDSGRCDGYRSLVPLGIEPASARFLKDLSALIAPLQKARR